tara:strand:+ start:55 stop:444 length:390 start_codon:yes stop_codon:yes gene_type:complete
MQRIFDTIGITISGTCAIHCLMAPVTVIILPLLGLTIVDEHILHEILLYLILPSALIAITMGCRKHKDYSVAALAIIGISLLVYTVVLHDTYNAQLITVMTFIGSTLLVVSHVRNYMLCRKADCQHNHN